MQAINIQCVSISSSRSDGLKRSRGVYATEACKIADASRQRRLNIMANTYSHCYNHFVFSTKNRVNFIDPQIEDRVWAYIGGIARKHGMTALQVGGVDDHIHALVSSPPSVAPSQIAQWIKGGSSHWIHNEFQHLNNFAWQDGFGVFAVCKSHASTVVEYIKSQRKHHEKQTFEEPFRGVNATATVRASLRDEQRTAFKTYSEVGR